MSSNTKRFIDALVTSIEARLIVEKSLETFLQGRDEASTDPEEMGMAMAEVLLSKLTDKNGNLLLAVTHVMPHSKAMA